MMREGPKKPVGRLPIAVDEVVANAPHTTPPAGSLPVPVEYREFRKTQPNAMRPPVRPAPIVPIEPAERVEPVDEMHTAVEEARVARAAEKVAKARAADLAAQLAAARRPREAPPAPISSLPPRGPTIALGDAKWWVLVIGALAAGSAGLSALVVKWHEVQRPTATQAQVKDVKDDVSDTTKLAKKQADELKKATADNEQRARISAAFLCAQGLRANGLDCDLLLKQVKFQAQPLNPKRGTSLFHTSSEWPPIPEPPEN